MNSSALVNIAVIINYFGQGVLLEHTFRQGDLSWSGLDEGKPPLRDVGSSDNACSTTVITSKPPSSSDPVMKSALCGHLPSRPNGGNPIVYGTLHVARKLLYVISAISFL